MPLFLPMRFVVIDGGAIMGRVLVSIGATLLFAGSAAGLSVGLTPAAFAADLGRPAPPVYTKALPLPASDWTGFYAGVNAGWGRANPGSIDDGVTGGGLVPSLFDPNTFSLSSNGVVAGGHLGYNYQFAPTWVFGVEG